MVSWPSGIGPRRRQRAGYGISADEDAKKKGEEEKGGGSGIGGRGGAAVLIPLSMKEEKNWQIV